MPERRKLTKVQERAWYARRHLAFCARDLEHGSYLMLGKGEGTRTVGRFREFYYLGLHWKPLIGARYYLGWWGLLMRNELYFQK